MHSGPQLNTMCCGNHWKRLFCASCV